MTLVPFVALAQNVTLTPNNEKVVVHIKDVVTFKYENDLHHKYAKEVGLKHIFGLTYSAGVIFSTSFYDDYVSRGKVFNYTNNPIKVKCVFYHKNNRIVDYITTINPRTFMRMIPDDVDDPEFCDKIIIGDDKYE